MYFIIVKVIKINRNASQFNIQNHKNNNDKFKEVEMNLRERNKEERMRQVNSLFIISINYIPIIKVRTAKRN